MRQKSKITDDEKALFRKIAQKVKPRTHSKHVPAPYRPKQTPPPIKEPSFHFSETASLPTVTGSDYLQFARPGLQPKVLRDLKSGQYPIEAVLDLHGKTVDEASYFLGDFLLQCREREIRSALIIHGKGQHSSIPILKNKLNHWLRQCDDILAFCSAKIKDGASGSVYVLLKKSVKK